MVSIWDPSPDESNKLATWLVRINLQISIRTLQVNPLKLVKLWSMKNYVHITVIIHLPGLFANLPLIPSPCPTALLRIGDDGGVSLCCWWTSAGKCLICSGDRLRGWKQNLVCSWRVRCRHHYRIKSTLTYFPTILHFTPLNHWRTIRLLLLIIRRWLLSCGSFGKL